MNELLTYLRQTAAQHIACDNEDFEVNDYAGGNIDDAYELGVTAGEVAFARELLQKYTPEGFTL